MSIVLKRHVSGWPIGAIVTLSTFSWFLIQIVTPDTGKGWPYNLSDLGWAVLLGCPLLNLMFALAITWDYMRQPRLRTGRPVFLVVLAIALLPWAWVFVGAAASALLTS